ncbi:hypothetical protein QCD85_23460 [Paenibacillus sp. PsM32]|uniref:hypothetical protein n=1 Tax=Paenibacillus sp. PsM32 TaxID=3030536 RepID=UPI00263BB8AA|nr:hypothetical protein [Paenibacillus sp. PsM32]MDN4621094.1 hypothetical protein [Paenibacillus sp. PsM32]
MDQKKIDINTQENTQDLNFELDLKVYEVSSATVLEAMGASKAGSTSCSVIVQTRG